ncbi:hypothetical protein IV203_009030 [Nitzschia inconspicua]|uniref:Uncharacterized protein n=1 Tax=Nitzschia inconspicua TaxID=303405 RepID=A0A9K3L018_9STRA|nr:hypothetical protein IV203_009030 [Nitzschia inconspicua]
MASFVPWNHVAYHLTWIHDFDFDQPAVTEFQAWTRAAATASETDPTISALATTADLLPLDQLPTLERDLQTWLADQVSHLDPGIQAAWTTVIAAPSSAEKQSGHQHTIPLPTSPPSPTNTPASTTDIMAAIATMGDKFGDKLAAALQTQHQPPQAGLMPDQIVQLVAHINQMTQRNQVPTQEQTVPAGRLSAEQRIALHGWSNLSPSEPLAEFWTHYDNTKTTGTLETTIKHHLFKPLQTAEPTFDSTILNKTLIATVSTQAFIPMGKNLGLGPLACVFRPRGEITKLDNNYTLLQESKSVSVSDTQRTKLNTPVPPTDPPAFDGLLRRLIVLHAILFTETCPMVTQLTQLHTALCQRMGYYLERSPAFRACTAPAILATLTRAITEFFEMIPTQSELDCGTYPTVPVLPTLLEKIKDGNILEDTKDIPDMFFHPTVLKERQQLPPPPPPRSLDSFSVVSALTTPTKFSNHGQRSPALTTRLNRNHHPALTAAVQSWQTSHPNSPLPRLRDILTCNKMDTNEALTTCKLAQTDCLRYVLLGSCVGPCSLTHPNHTNLPHEFLNQFCVALNNTRPSKRLKPHTGKLTLHNNLTASHPLDVHVPTISHPSPPLTPSPPPALQLTAAQHPTATHTPNVPCRRITQSHNDQTASHVPNVRVPEIPKPQKDPTATQASCSTITPHQKDPRASHTLNVRVPTISQIQTDLTATHTPNVSCMTFTQTYNDPKASHTLNVRVPTIFQSHNDPKASHTLNVRVPTISQSHNDPKASHTPNVRVPTISQSHNDPKASHTLNVRVPTISQSHNDPKASHTLNVRVPTISQSHNDPKASHTLNVRVPTISQIQTDPTATHTPNVLVRRITLHNDLPASHTPNVNAPTISHPTLTLTNPSPTTLQLTAAQSKLHPHQLMFPRNIALRHPAAPTLLDWAINGCPTTCGPNWTLHQLNAYLTYGNHSSTHTPLATQAIQAETNEKVKAGICEAVPWSQIRLTNPPTLKVSPLAAIPHKTRRFRLIHDLSFSLPHSSGSFSPVNAFSDTANVPHHSMHELGHVIPRILHHMATAPAHTPLFLTKIDIKDGYWRMRVCKDGKWNFAYTLPRNDPKHELLVVLCLTLPMGWVDSPPFFCAVTETARDIMHAYEALPELPPHPLEHHMLNLTKHDAALLHHPPSPLPSPLPPALQEVYIDDFIALCPAKHLTHLQHHSRAMLHAIHDLFPPPDITGSTMEDPISIKKLASEGTWSTTKEVLGWLLNGQERTVSITYQKFQKVTSQISTLRRRRRVPMKDLVKLQGKLNWLSNAIVTGKPLLGELDMFLHQHRHQNWVTLPSDILILLQDWQLLIQQLHARPISVHELLPNSKPAYQGWTDASTSWGAGGVWFGAAQPLIPIVWSIEWPPDIIQAIQQSCVSINTLELFTILAHHLVLEAAVPTATLHHASVAIWCDNTTAVAWANKLRSSSCHFAHRILRLLTMRLLHNQECPFTTTHITGEYNTLADFASRKHPTDPHAFLTAFTSSFPPPQNNFWTLCHLPNETQQKLFSLLRPQPLAMELALLGAFAAFIRAGQHQPANKQVSAQTVLLALRAISQTHMLDGQPDPLADEKGQRHILLRRQIENYRQHDPPPKRKLALPHIAIKYLNVTRADNNPRYQAIHDLCTIAWFYLLRVGEYTQTTQTARRRTIQFRLEDVTLWNHTQVLHSTLPLQTLLSQCTAATLRISNQKNGRRNQVIHQEATRDVTCPIAAIIRRVHHIRQHTSDPATMLGTYFTGHKHVAKQVTVTDITTALKNTVQVLGLSRYNITPADISSHSLRAGGAMALHLGGVPAHTIKILGRWSSDTFLLYIQEQITGFSAGLSTQMSSTPLTPNAAIKPTLRLLPS